MMRPPIWALAGLLYAAGAQAAVPAGTYRVILQVNNQQAKSSPRVVIA